MHHFKYSKFSLEARNLRAKLVSEFEPWEWFGEYDPSDPSLSDAKRTVLQMDEILKTVDPALKDDIIDSIEDLSVENKIKLAELFGIQYDPPVVEEEW